MIDTTLQKLRLAADLIETTGLRAAWVDTNGPTGADMTIGFTHTPWEFHAWAKAIGAVHGEIDTHDGLSHITAKASVGEHGIVVQINGYVDREARHLPGVPIEWFRDGRRRARYGTFAIDDFGAAYGVAESEEVSR